MVKGLYQRLHGSYGVKEEQRIIERLRVENRFSFVS